MTTRCRCDWVETQADRAHRVTPAKTGPRPERAPNALNGVTPQRMQDISRLPVGQAAPPFISEYAA